MKSGYLLAIAGLLSLFGPASTLQQALWTWSCDADKEACTRTSGQAAPYPSLETCRLVCGKYGGLWPRPTGSVDLGEELLKFPAAAIKFDLAVAEGEAKRFLEQVADIFLRSLPQDSCARSAEVTVRVSVGSESLALDWATKEDYRLVTTSRENRSSVDVVASTVFGARHALETLSQLIEAFPEPDGTRCLATPRSVALADEPAYPHRGLLLDTARNFQSVAVIKKHLAAMAASKLNVLHWHITDSQSFPLELPSLPNMTRYGAYSASKIYHVDEIRELLSFAKLRGVRVLIEIDSPSHVGNGWQWGPEAGLGDLAVCINQAPYRSYCIQPPCGQLNPVNENLYQVLKALYADVVDLLPKGEVFHMGGDEVYIPCWNSTPEIVAYLGDKPRTTETFLDLWSDFQAKALEMFDSVANRSDTPIILWTSHLTEVDVIQKYLSKDRYVIQTWVPASDSLPTDLLSLGYRIIVSTKDTWYLDHGFWGSTVYHNWQTVYNNKIPRSPRVLGGEVCMWGEYVDDSSVESRTWPRAAAAAERLWSDPSSASGQAQRRFFRHRERLVARGVNAEALLPRWCYQNEGAC